jgi:hypothetical protein
MSAIRHVLYESEFSSALAARKIAFSGALIMRSMMATVKIEDSLADPYLITK